jgi:hypothetical protein
MRNRIDREGAKSAKQGNEAVSEEARKNGSQEQDKLKNESKLLLPFFLHSSLPDLLRAGLVALLRVLRAFAVPHRPTR